MLTLPKEVKDQIKLNCKEWNTIKCDQAGF